VIALNFGCNIFKLPNFINLDIDPNNNPDLLMDVTRIREYYDQNTVDIIHAGHFFEHLSWNTGRQLMRDAREILRPFAPIIITIPDYRKTVLQNESDDNAERIIFGGGEHQTLYSTSRLAELAQQAGFRIYTELELDRNPWLILPAGVDPKPETWQTSFVAIKT
jgi:predicted SAM-dependent methyltransferase